VSAATTATATVIAEAKPIVAMAGMPAILQAGDGDHDRRAGEHHRAAGRGVGEPGRLDDRPAFVEERR
jgi:hypothetical protein